jgi:hypothetical protein
MKRLMLLITILMIKTAGASAFSVSTPVISLKTIEGKDIVISYSLDFSGDLDNPQRTSFYIGNFDSTGACTNTEIVFAEASALDVNDKELTFVDLLIGSEPTLGWCLVANSSVAEQIGPTSNALRLGTRNLDEKPRPIAPVVSSVPRVLGDSITVAPAVKPATLVSTGMALIVSSISGLLVLGVLLILNDKRTSSSSQN